MDLISKDKGITKKPEEIYEEEVNKTREKVWYLIFDSLFGLFYKISIQAHYFILNPIFYFWKSFLHLIKYIIYAKRTNLLFAPALLLIF